MANYRQAPKLIHVGNKTSSNKNVLIIPQDIAIIICSTLSGKNGNALKLLMFLIGTIGDGSFKISESWIMKSTGMMKTSYINARKTLCDIGWVELEKGSIKLNFNEIRKCKVSTSDESEELGTSDDTSINNRGHITEIEVTSNKNRVHDTEELGSCDLSYNKDIINNNKDIVINKDEFFDFYFNLSHCYNIQNENEVKKRIDKKLPENIDRLDFFDFWLNLKTELYDIREKKKDKVLDGGVLEYDLRVALNKYNEYFPKLIAAGYKMYRSDILKAYDQTAFEKACSAVSKGYYEFLEDNLYVINFKNDKYQVSTYMKYRNAEEKRLAKIKNKDKNYERQDANDCTNEY